MRKQTARRGFTITELVIVIVVIAILAAVLIPTFASLIKKANISADTQLARNLNTALTMAEAEGDKVDEFSEVLDAARDAGYIISNLNPTAKNCYFVWEKETNQFLLVDGEKDYKVIYAAEKDHPAIGETWHFATADRKVAEKLKADAVKYNNFKVMDMYAAAEDVSKALAVGGEQTLYLDESVALDTEHMLIVDKEDANITLEMGESSLNTSGVVVSSTDIIPFRVNKGQVTVNGGVIAAAGQAHNTQGQLRAYALRTEPGTVATFNGTKFDLATYNAQMKLGGKVTLKDVSINATKVGVDTINGGDVTLDNVTITSNGKGEYYGTCVWACDTNHIGNAKVTIKSGTYSATPSNGYAALYSCGGDIIIEGGTFTATSSKMFYVAHNTAEITVSAGATFNGKTASQLGVSGLQAMTVSGTVREVGNTFVISK